MISKKIHIISCPRSKSTCITRVLEESLNYKVIHEPYIPVHDKVHYADLTKDWFKGDSFTTPTEINNLIQSIVQTGTGVIIKDISFSLVDYVNDISNPDTKYIFLFRDPLSIAVSLLNKCDGNVIYDDIQKLIGLGSMLEIYEKMTTLVPNIAPNIVPKTNILIVNTEDILLSLEKIFKFIGKKFDKNNLIFKKPDNIESVVENWHESKKQYLFEYWHGQAITSDVIITDKKYHTINDFNYDVYKKYYDMITDHLEKDYNKLRSLSSF